MRILRCVSYVVALIGLVAGSAQAVPIVALVDLGSNGSATGTAVSNTNLMGPSGVSSSTLSSVVDLSGNTISGLSITATTSSTIGTKFHVNGGGAVLNSTTVAANTPISNAFGSYERAYSSSWGPENAGVANTYTVALNGLATGYTYTVQIIAGRNGGIGLPSSMSSTWTLSSGSATLDTVTSIYDYYDAAPTPTNGTVSVTGTGPYTLSHNLVVGDVGMTTWKFDVTGTGADVTLGFVNPINAMKISISPVPEPSSLALLAIGGVGLLARRRKR